MAGKAAEAGTKRALVTGAGAGLGREVALQLAGRGCRVVALDINRMAAEETARACGSGAVSIVDDLTRDGAPEDAIRGVVDRWGGIDILVNNAGYGAIEPFLKMTAALWHAPMRNAPIFVE